MSAIDKYRQEINKVDKEIIQKIASRLELCKRIGQIKKKIGKDVKDSSREALLLRYHEEQCQHNGVDAGMIKKIFSLIISESKRLQK